MEVKRERGGKGFRMIISPFFSAATCRKKREEKEEE